MCTINYTFVYTILLLNSQLRVHEKFLTKSIKMTNSQKSSRENQNLKPFFKDNTFKWREKEVSTCTSCTFPIKNQTILEPLFVLTISWKVSVKLSNTFLHIFHSQLRVGGGNKKMELRAYAFSTFKVVFNHKRLQKNIRWTKKYQFTYMIWFIVFNATFSNISAISWWQVLMVEEAGVPSENHQPWASNW